MIILKETGGRADYAPTAEKLNSNQAASWTAG
jgi:hypothetical protein